jgi:hypothetical protein
MPSLRIAILALALGIAGAADDLADFNAALKLVESYDDEAIDRLARDKYEFALFNIEQLREPRGALQKRFAGRPPAVLAGNPVYGNLFTGVRARLVAADLMLNSGRPQAAGHSLEALRRDLNMLQTILLQ